MEGVTERRQAGPSLEEIGHLFHQVTENAREVFWLSTPDWSSVLYISPGYERIWGRSCESLYARPQDLLDSVVEEDREQVMNALNQKISGDLSKIAFPEFQILRPDGSKRWILARTFPVYDAEGKVYQISGIAEDITERKQAEEATLEREATLLQFKNTLDQTQDGVFIFQSDTLRIVYVNYSAIKQIGYSEDELLRMTPVDFKPEFDEQCFRALLNPFTDEGATAKTFETVHRHKDGHDIPVEIVLQLVNSDGMRAFYVAFTRDITERKLSEKMLRQNAERLDMALNAANEGMWELNVDTGQLYFSSHWGQLFGYKQEELPKSFEEWKSLIHPEDKDRVIKGVNEHLQNLKPHYESEYRIRSRSGEWVWILGHGKIISWDHHNNPLHITGTTKNITQRKQAEEQLRIAAVAFETHEGILITDVNANIIRVNRAFTNITGYSSEEVLGKNPRIFKSGRHNKEFYKAMWHHLLNTGTWSGEIWDRRKSGEVYPKWMTITAVKNEAGKATEYVAFFSDISLRKKAEEEICNLAYYDPLTKLPNRRLLNNRLEQAMDASKRSGCYGALLFMDMDNFKPLNDMHGHLAGDALLIEVALRLNGLVRKMDTVARFGGDEFVVVLSELNVNKACSTKQASDVVENIRSALSEPYILQIQHEGKAETTIEHRCTLSIGVVLFIGHDASVENLFKWADMAMYQAKQAGSNLIRIYDSKEVS